MRWTACLQPPPSNLQCCLWPCLQYLHANPNVRLVLLDDGLQHLPLVRDLEVVMVNSLSPLGNGHLFPRGSLLEPPKAALRRADAVVLHHADLAGELAGHVAYAGSDVVMAGRPAVMLGWVAFSGLCKAPQS